MTNGDRVGAIVTSGHLLGKQLPASLRRRPRRRFWRRDCIFDVGFLRFPEDTTSKGEK